MKTFEFDGWVYAEPAPSFNKGDTNVLDGFIYRVTGFKPTDCIGTAKVVVTVNEGFDPRKKAIKDLEEAKRQLTANFQARITEIDRQISKFTAIECC